MRKLSKILATSFAVILLSPLFLKAGDICDEPALTTEGPVLGIREKDTCAYKGIPYAKAPVGKLRWKPPQPAEKRSGVMETVAFGPRCEQIGMGIPKFLMKSKDQPSYSEDCLYINIWRPAKEGVFPVMFWIHGGGLVAGAGSEPMYHGDRLVSREDVVLVTFNYRLGALGFLAYPELSEEDPHSSSGNYGMLDQIAALEWVNENIANFGGDPDNITIFGESAGGWSVCNLLASPLAKGLFQKAILQSGGCDVTRTMPEGYEDGKAFAEKLGCASSGDVLECMRSKPVDKVLKATSWEEEMSPFDLGHWEHLWVSKEDGWFLEQTPIDALRSGNYNRVPLMVGSNRDEYRLFVILTTARLTPKCTVKRKIRKTAGDDFLAEFMGIYPFKRYKRPADAALHAKGDMTLGCKTFEAAEAGARAGQPTYYYRFDYDESRFPDMLGAAHAFELPFIFNSLDRPYFDLLYSDKQERKAQPLVHAMGSYWANFAATGDPNGEDLLYWPPYEIPERKRMIFDLPMRIQPAENVDRCEFWRERRK